MIGCDWIGFQVATSCGVHSKFRYKWVESEKRFLNTGRRVSHRIAFRIWVSDPTKPSIERLLHALIAILCTVIALKGIPSDVGHRYGLSMASHLQPILSPKLLLFVNSSNVLQSKRSLVRYYTPITAIARRVSLFAVFQFQSHAISPFKHYLIGKHCLS